VYEQTHWAAIAPEVGARRHVQPWAHLARQRFAITDVS